MKRGRGLPLLIALLGFAVMMGFGIKMSHDDTERDKRFNNYVENQISDINTLRKQLTDKGIKPAVPAPPPVVNVTGAQGIQGVRGPRGVQGQTGPMGPAGVQGPPGAPGPKGDPGAEGPAGPKGEAGPAGAQGDAGPEGAKGEQGIAGPAGPICPEGYSAQPSTIATSTGTKDVILCELSRPNPQIGGHLRYGTRAPTIQGRSYSVRRAGRGCSWCMGY